jgi:ATP-dependent Lon protease
VDKLPLFPLERVTYPEERIALHIFEPRYKEMIRVCLEEQRTFGVLLNRGEEMAAVGCTATVDRIVNRYADGRIDLLAVGRDRFRVLEVFEDLPYLTANVELVRDRPEPVPTTLKERAITQHMKLLELSGKKMRPNVYQNTTNVSFVLARNAALSVEQKQEVLEIISENERIEYLVDHFEAIIPQIKEAETTKRKVRSNGHFPDFPDKD